MVARGCTRTAGWVPADAAGTGLIAFHRAAANCERAEFAVHTNTTRGTEPVPASRSLSPAWAAAQTIGSSRHNCT